MQRVLIPVLAVLLLCSFAGCSSSTPPAVAKSKIQVGIMSFEARAGVQPGEAESVADVLATMLQRSGRFVVVERKTLNAIVQEKEFQASQEENARLAATGKVLAMKKVITGSLGRLGTKYVFHLKMIDVESSTVDLALSQPYEDDLGDIGEEFIPEIVGQLIQAIDGSSKK